VTAKGAAANTPAEGLSVGVEGMDGKPEELEREKHSVNLTVYQ
jgi:hypothetical protein